MSIKQLIILSVVVVALVFLITFATQYLGQDNKPPPGADQVVQAELLKFPRTKSDLVKKDDMDPGRPPIREWNQPGHEDFWFQNDSGGPVQFGVNTKSCKCTSVEVCIVPEEQWKSASPGQPKDPPPGADWKSLPEFRLGPSGVAVPPGAGGWVRLEWKPEKPGPENLKASLWTRAASGQYGKQIDLEVPLLLVEPVDCQEEEKASGPTNPQARAVEKYVGKLGAGEVRRASFLCWSFTRPEFDLKPEPSRNACVVVEEPVKLSAEECGKLSERLSKPPEQPSNPSERFSKLPVLSAYRVTVAVHEQFKDQQLDLGLFRYRVGLASTSASANPMDVFVSGEVEGPVEMTTPDGRSRIDLGQFTSSEDKKVDILLWTSDRSLRLELDERRTAQGSPAFRVKAPEESKDARGTRWAVELTVPKGTMDGPFPVRDPANRKPGYDDCAVYLSIYKAGEAGSKPGEPWRRIRIPVSGNATH